MINGRQAIAERTTPLRWVLMLTFIASLGTGVFWHGLSFIAAHTYRFEQGRNFALYALMGALYAVGALGAGRAIRLTAKHLSPRGVLACCIGIEAAVCMLPVVWTGEWTLWVSGSVVTFLSAIHWPIVESYISAGRHGPAMRNAVLSFNLTWMPATVVPMLVMAPLLERHGAWTIGGLALANLAALGLLPLFSRRPAPHREEEASPHVAAAYPLLLRSARVLLPVSYVLTSALAPILPYRFEQVGVAVWWQTPSTATWMIVRVVSLGLMWLAPFWHGRWGTLVLGAVTMTGGFALIVLGPSIGVMLAGFACMGIGLGIVYNVALYYAMAVGRAAVEAGGTHEALIGTGYTLGPLAGLLGSALGGGAHIVGVVWCIVGVAAVPASLPYLKYRRLRRLKEQRASSAKEVS